MTQQDLLNQELFKVNNNGQIYNSITGDIMPNNKVWIRLSSNTSFGVKDEPWVGKDSSTVTPTGDTENKYYSFGTSLDTTGLTYRTGAYQLPVQSNNGYYWVEASFLGDVLYIPQEAFGTGISNKLIVLEIAIPNSATWIGPKAFSNLTKLRSVIIGSGVKFMNSLEWKENGYISGAGGWICDDNYMLWHITCLAKTAPATGNKTFSLTHGGTGTETEPYELCKHYIENQAIQYDNLSGPEVNVPNNINLLTVPTGAVGYTSSYWDQLTGSSNSWGFQIQNIDIQDSSSSGVEIIWIPKDWIRKK